jgi:hypothetical protein
MESTAKRRYERGPDDYLDAGPVASTGMAPGGASPGVWPPSSVSVFYGVGSTSPGDVWAVGVVTRT